MSELNVYKPKMATKNLQIQETSKGRKLVISTNFLPLFGFEASEKVIEKVIGENKGLEITLASPDEEGRVKKVYSRTYKTRRNNPIETLLDIRSQDKINAALGSAKNVHITFVYGKITIIPVEDKKAERIKKAKRAKNSLGAFVACSSGIDATSIARHNFRIDALLEYRPNESRDKRDFSETGVMCALANLNIANVINEDITTVDTQIIQELVSKANTSLFSVSTQCDDMSPAKAKSLKEKSLEVKEDGSLDTTIDHFFDVLRITFAGQFPFLLLENVGPFLNTQYYTFFKARLNRWGYKVYAKNIDSSLHGGCQKRKRAYVFATTFDTVPFNFPEEKLSTLTPEDFWKKNVDPFLSGCRNVTHSKSIQDGAKGGRLRVVNRESTHFPVLLKSQSRLAKDTLVIQDKGRYFFPSEELERHIMGIPNSFTLNACAKTISSEILGQAVEFNSHEKIMDEVVKHIDLAISPIRMK